MKHGISRWNHVKSNQVSSWFVIYLPFCRKSCAESPAFPVFAIYHHHTIAAILHLHSCFKFHFFMTERNG